MGATVRRIFGTDGIRGEAGRGLLSAEAVLALGRAVADHFSEGGGPVRLFVGRDTRLSGPMLEAAFSAGVAASGGEVVLGGVMPTPAVAYLTRVSRADAGAVISASHNPYRDNGIKLFAADGYKLADADEADIEARLADRGRTHRDVDGGMVGRLYRDDDAVNTYVEHLVEVVGPRLSLSGLKLVVDTAHGAASSLAAPLFRSLGAGVVAMGDAPDGYNINAGVGALHVEALRDTVLSSGADLGIALDGDADRAVFVDRKGTVRNGDDCLALFATYRRERGRLPGDTVVATTMSNLGLEVYLAEHGISLVRAAVGDRYVLEALKAGGWLLGGEQSGHIIMLDKSTTGDGMLTALEMCRILVERAEPLDRLLGGFDVFPQVLVNVPVKRREPLDRLPPVNAAVARAEARLGSQGRVVLRYSGTEPLARVMIEGRSQAVIETLAGDIAEEISRLLG